MFGILNTDAYSSDANQKNNDAIFEITKLLKSVGLRLSLYAGIPIGLVHLHALFHRRTRASYVHNGCRAWYNVVLTKNV